MPEIYFKGKEFVYNHHLNVPYRPLNPDADASVGDTGLNGNLIVHGDNLHALKALLPLYANRVDVIYIDPPYNTGNESWFYNDNVNSPMMREWLASNPVNRDDMLRHDKWLCLIYPRLKLLHELLAPHGVIFVSIDDNELYHLRLCMDEIFGDRNWVGTIVWKNVTDNNPTNIAIEHEYIVCFAKDKDQIQAEWKSSISDVKERLIEVGRELIEAHEAGRGLIGEEGEPAELQRAYSRWFSANRPFIWPFQDYKFIDKGGIYTGSRSVHNPGKEGYRYPVYHPDTGRPCKEPLMGYRFPEETMRQLLEDKRILFGQDETKIIELKLYVHEYQDKLPGVIQLDGRAGANELREIFPDRKKAFDNPKPSQLLLQLLSFTAPPNSLVLDSFAGSGTTGHAILELNKRDDGNRRFILVEGEDYAQELTAERVKRVIEGVPSALDVGLKEGFGGTFTYCDLGAPMDLDALLTGEHLPEYHAIGSWLFHTATGKAIDATAVEAERWFLGEGGGYHVWLIYKPDLNFLKSRDAALTLEFAEKLSGTVTGAKHLVFAPAKFVPNKMLLPLGVEYAPLPFALYRVERG